LGFSKCLRAELLNSGVRVTAVMPGATYTDSWVGSPLPEERFMPSEDIATLVYFTYSLSGRSVVEDIVIRPQMGDL
jgi:short-subunit dehydrogenase